MKVKKNLLAKSIFAIALVVLIGWAAFPPKEKVILGLDLKGGIHLVLEVDTDSALKGELSEMKQRLGQFLKDNDVAIKSESVADDLSIRFVVPTTPAKNSAVALFDEESGTRVFNCYRYA